MGNSWAFTFESDFTEGTLPEDSEAEKIQNPEPDLSPARRGRGIRLANAWRAWAGSEIPKDVADCALNMLRVEDPLNILEQILPHQRKAESTRGDSALLRSVFLAVVERAKHDVQLRATRWLSDWVKKQRANDFTYDTRRVQDSSEREAYIRMPLAVRFADAAREAELKTILPRKVSSALQLAVVAQICLDTFEPPDQAAWVPFDSNVFAASHHATREAVALELWQAVIAGLIERRRFGAEWRYTAVPEAWPMLPDHTWYVDAYRGPRPAAEDADEDADEDDDRGNRADSEARA